MAFDRLDGTEVNAAFDRHRLLNYSPPSYSIVY